MPIKRTHISLLAFIAILLFVSTIKQPVGIKLTGIFSTETNKPASIPGHHDDNTPNTSVNQHTYTYSGQNQIDSSVETVDYFAVNGYGKPVSTMQHPAGEYYHGVTYLAYQGPHEDPFVCTYNHATGEWAGPVRAGISALGRTPQPTDPNRIDNHGRPALIIDNQGYIHLFYGGHGGRREFGPNPLGRHGRGRQTHAVSKNPGDISTWEMLDNISPFGTYSQLIKMPNGGIFLFYRHGSHRSDWVYQKSTDNARTFSNPVSILKHKPQEGNPTVYDTWYAWFQEGPENTIYATFNYHPCANPGHSSTRLNAYTMKMNVEGGYWENMLGERLQMPLTKESADKMTIIVNTKGEKTRLGTIKVDASGVPHQYFRHGGKFMHYRWIGENWQVLNTLAPEARFSDADLLLDGEKTVKVLGVELHNSIEAFCQWTSCDGGESWEKGKPVISASETKIVMSSVIKNAHPDARVIVAEIPVNSLYSKLYLIGDSSPMHRKAGEVSKK